MKNHKFHRRIKHIDIRYHFLREKYEERLFQLQYIGTQTYKITIYIGKQSIKGESLTETIVSDLCQNYLNEGQTIFTDNFYTSVPLVEKMLSKNTHLVGTLRKNRRFLPKTVFEKKIKKGEIFGLENNSGVVVSKFKDKRDIYLLCTRHLLSMSNTEKKLEITKIYSNRMLYYKLEETEDKCQRNRKIRRCTECYRKYSAELDYK